MEFHIPINDSVIGFWLVNILLTHGRYLVSAVRKEVAVSMRLPWLVHILSTLRDAHVELLCHGRGDASVRSDMMAKGEGEETKDKIIN